MNIKKISDLPIGELGEENYVVADIDGEVKRVPAEDIGGGGGLPPVTGSGIALIAVDGQWTEQQGYPYDEGEIVNVLFDETFSGFTRESYENFIQLEPLENSDPDNENNVVIDDVTYYYVDTEVLDYTSISSCTLIDNLGNEYNQSDLIFIESGSVKKVAISYSFEQQDLETDMDNTLTGTLYGVYAPIDGAQDADGNTFPAAGFYCSVNGDPSDYWVGVVEMNLDYIEYSDEWIAIVSLDNDIEFDSEKNYRVCIDGKAAEDADAHETFIELDASGNNGVEIFEDDNDGFIALAYLYADDYEAAPESMKIEVDEVVSGLHKMDLKYIDGQTLPDASNLPDGTAMVVVDGEWKKQEGYGCAIPNKEEVFSGEVTCDDYSRFRFDNRFPMKLGKTRYIIEYDGTSYLSSLPFYGTYGEMEVSYTDSFLMLMEDGILSTRDHDVFTPGTTINITIYKLEDSYSPFSSDYIPWSEAPEGAGFPEVSQPDNGTAMIAVNGTWVKQSGYGYDYFGEKIAFEGDVRVPQGSRSLYFSNVCEMNIGETRYRIEFNGESYLSGVAQEGNNNIICYFDDDTPFSELVHTGRFYQDRLNLREKREQDEVLSLSIYRVDTFREKIDYSFIPWDEMPSEAIPWSDAPEGIGLPEWPSEIGTYMLTATIVSDDRSYAWTLPPHPDIEVIEGSTNLVTSGAVANAIANAIGNIDTLLGSGVIS